MPESSGSENVSMVVATDGLYENKGENGNIK